MEIIAAAPLSELCARQVPIRGTLKLFGRTPIEYGVAPLIMLNAANLAPQVIRKYR
jgi:hypothetical protein